MADANLTQAEADALTAMEKRRSDDTEWQYPDLGGYVTIPLFQWTGANRFSSTCVGARST